MAMQTAGNREQFETNGPAATRTILSKEVVHALRGVAGVQRAEFAVGVAGCSKRTTFVVICPEERGRLLRRRPGRFPRESQI
jgi:hypothetical protein